MGTVQQVRQERLADFEPLPAQVLAVELDQVESAMHGIRDGALTADQVENCEPGFVTNDRFAID